MRSIRLMGNGQTAVHSRRIEMLDRCQIERYREMTVFDAQALVSRMTRQHVCKLIEG